MRWKKPALIVAVVVVIGLVADLYLGQVLIAPAQRAIGPAPQDLGAEPVKLDSSVGPNSGWP